MSRASQRTRLVLAAGTALGMAVVVAPVAPATASEMTGPKNVILLISDGAGYNHFDITSLYEAGTSAHQVTVDPATGTVERAESTPRQSYESWPVQVGQSHHSASGRAEYVTEDAWGSFGWVASGATDSAAAGTALGTGVKTNNGVLGFDPEDNRLLTVGEQAMAVGKKVGLVTSVPFNHATPAGFIAHNSNRNDFQGLATEMIDSGVDVIMGGGHPNFTDRHTSRASNWTWISQPDFERVSTGGTDFTYVETRSAFEALAAGEDVPDKVFGLPQVASTLQYNRPGLDQDGVLPWTHARNDVPDLDVMTAGALNVLETDEDGFFLMVEGGAVDWAGHANHTTRTIEEQQDFNAAIDTVNEWVETSSSWDETLVVVTADHETGYLAGPGSGERWTPLTGTAGELPDVMWHSGGHTNALVPLFARGAGSELLAERASSWDLVRGAYLDNTDVGEVIFDLLGHAGTTEDGAVALEALVDRETPSGALELSLAVDRGVSRFTGDGGMLEAELPEVTVTDTRTETQARGQGWTASGTAEDFVAGNRRIGAANLAWTPYVVSSDADASAGPVATLEAPAALAHSNRTTRVGTTVLGADLDLTVPAEAANGSYGSQLTLTVFPRD